MPLPCLEPSLLSVTARTESGDLGRSSNTGGQAQSPSLSLCPLCHHPCAPGLQSHKPLVLLQAHLALSVPLCLCMCCSPCLARPFPFVCLAVLHVSLKTQFDAASSRKSVLWCSLFMPPPQHLLPGCGLCLSPPPSLLILSHWHSVGHVVGAL